MARTVNAETLALSKRLEACRLKSYPDPGSKDGKPVTVGYGTTTIGGRPISLGLTITQEQAETYHAEDLAKVSAFIERTVKVPLNDNQFGALVLFVNNIGGTKFAKSTLLRKLNAGDYDAVPKELARWTKNDGKEMRGLVNRRAAEAGLWAKGSFAASNTVAAAPGNPIKAYATPENLTAAGGLLSGAAALASGNGPVQIAVAAVLVLAAGVIAFLVVRKATR